jgi:hypothetical protein
MGNIIKQKIQPLGTWLEHKGSQAHGHHIWGNTNSKKQNPKIHVLVLIVLDFQSQIVLCSSQKID